MAASRAQQPVTLEDLFVRGLIASLILHIFFVWAFFPKPPVRYEAEPIMVDLVMNSPAQMVSPPDAGKETKQPLDTAFRSDKNLTVEKQQIKRGIDKQAGSQIAKSAPSKPSQASLPSPKPPAPAPKPAQPKPAAKQAASSALASNAAGKKITEFTLDPKTLIKEFGADPDPQRPSQSQQSQVQPIGSYRAFSRPSGSGARFLGQNGSPDYLPNLPDGDITLLNTKASRFAVFVRRVATQVFTQLRLNGWDSLLAQDIHSIHDFSTVRAVLDMQGKLLSVTFEGVSGSTRFDNVVKTAVSKGTQDPNPPREAAADDGNIHFIFKARSWSQFVTSARSGAPVEKRWLLLATGLD